MSTLLCEDRPRFSSTGIYSPEDVGPTSDGQYENCYDCFCSLGKVEWRMKPDESGRL